MGYIMVDVEADGPVPGDYSMISLGAVIVDNELDKSFYSKLRPVSERFDPKALGVSGFTRDETMQFDDPAEVMEKLRLWINKNCKGQPVFVPDNNG